MRLANSDQAVPELVRGHGGGRDGVTAIGTVQMEHGGFSPVRLDCCLGDCAATGSPEPSQTLSDLAATQGPGPGLAPFGCIIIENRTLKPAVKPIAQRRPWRTSSSQRGSIWPARSPS